MILSGEREVVGMLISHAGDLLISGYGAFIDLFLGSWEMSKALKFLRKLGRVTWS